MMKLKKQYKKGGFFNIKEEKWKRKEEIYKLNNVIVLNVLQLEILRSRQQTKGEG